MVRERGVQARELASRAAYEGELKTLPYYNAFMNFRLHAPYATELAAKIASLLPAGLSRIVFAEFGFGGERYWRSIPSGTTGICEGQKQEEGSYLARVRLSPG